MTPGRFSPLAPCALLVALLASAWDQARASDETERVRIAAIGDVMFHRDVKRAAQQHATADNHGGFDWVWGDTRGLLHDADLAFGNLESPLAERNNRGVFGEVFNGPAVAAASLAHLGIDVLALANNHSLDQGPLGLLETLDVVRDQGIAAVGAGPTCEAARAPFITEIRGVKIGFIALTDLINYVDKDYPEDMRRIAAGTGDAPCVFVSGQPCQGKECGADRDAIHYRFEKERVLDHVREVSAKVHALVVSVHWGIEYTTEPLREYRTLGPQLIEAGASVVLGHHPHVLQPIERHRTADGRTGLIAYSLGNFVSNMASSYRPGVDPNNRAHTRDGIVLRLELVARRLADGGIRVDVEAVRAHPLWTENDKLTRGKGPVHVRVVTHEAARARATANAPREWVTSEVLDLRRRTVEDVVGAEWITRP